MRGDNNEKKGKVFSTTDIDIETLVLSISNGSLGLPDIQRPFVWTDVKVRDLFDSLFHNYPVGSLMLWEADEKSGTSIGTNPKSHQLNSLIIDGQQRLTSLYAVMLGRPVLDKNKKERKKN